MTTERDDEVPVPLRGERTVPGSVNALIASYYCSPEFRRNNRRVIEQFRNEHGTTLIARFDRAHIKEIIGAKATTREAANNLLKVLCMLLNHGVKIGMIASNPVIGMLDEYREPENRKTRINKQYRNKRNWWGTKLYSLNGEKLFASEIYQKVKPNVTLKRFRNRLDHGWSVDKAVAMPIRPTNLYFWNGEKLSASEIYRKVKPKITIQGFYKRLSHGWSIEEAVAGRGINAKLYSWNGEKLLASEIYRLAKPKIALKAFYARLRYGWSIEEAVAIPPGLTRRRSFEGDPPP